MNQPTTKEPHTLVLLDASNLICRAYFAMKSMGRNFTAPDGTPTGGLSTYLRMIEAIRKRVGNATFLALHEHPGGSFRDALSVEYKAQRPSMDPELKQQLALGQSLVPLLGIQALNKEGLEADDLIIAYAKAAAAKGFRVIICSSDKDMAQVVGDNVFILNPNDKEMNLMGVPEVEDKFGVSPGQIVEYLALMGDAVDGIAGVDGIGKKTAAKLLQKYGTIDKILLHIDDLTSGQQAAFVAAKERLPLAIKLATAKTDFELPVQLEAIRAHAPDWSAALPELERLAFKSWIDRAKTEISKQSPPPEQLASGATEGERQLKLPGF